MNEEQVAGQAKPASYTVRAVAWHNQELARSESLVDAISIKTLMLNRYGFEVGIFDADDYLVPLREQNAALEEVLNRCRVRHPYAEFL